MGVFVPVVDLETPRGERDGSVEAKHRAFHEAHTLHRGAASNVRDTAAQEATQVGDLPSFLPSPVWRGAKPGYVFARRQEGQGYFLDDAALARQARHKPAEQPKARRIRSRSRSPRRRPVEKRAFDPAKLSAPLARRPAEESAVERQAAALARLAEQRAQSSKPGRTWDAFGEWR